MKIDKFNLASHRSIGGIRLLADKKQPYLPKKTNKTVLKNAFDYKIS